PDTTSPVISGVSATPDVTSAVITWQTDEVADSLGDYGLTATYVSNVSDAALVKNHSITLTGLAAATAYHYRVTSKDVAGNTAASGDFTFTTATVPDAPLPAPVAMAGGGGGGFSGGGGGGGGGTFVPTSAVAGEGLTSPALIEITKTTAIVQQNARLTSTDGKTTLSIGKGTKMTGSDGKPVTALSLASVVSPPEPPQDKAILIALDLGPDGTIFAPFATLAIKFDARALPEGVKADELYIAFRDGQQWQQLESTVNLSTSTVSARVTHFTNFAVMGVTPVKSVPAPVQTPAPAPAPEPATPAPIPTPEPAPAPLLTLAPELPATAPSPSVTPGTALAPEAVHPPEILPATPPQVSAPVTQPGPNPGLTPGLAIGLGAAVILVVAVLFLKRKPF
ncbi:MAG: hypothetical protein HYX79_09535, partial [Chloroflexi bacterium]|nr:hypothetical protein [Chloroflexota bacterium]